MSARSKLFKDGTLRWVKRDGKAKRKAYRKQQRISRRANRRKK